MNFFFFGGEENVLMLRASDERSIDLILNNNIFVISNTTIELKCVVSNFVK